MVGWDMGSIRDALPLSSLFWQAVRLSLPMLFSSLPWCHAHRIFQAYQKGNYNEVICSFNPSLSDGAGDIICSSLVCLIIICFTAMQCSSLSDGAGDEFGHFERKQVS